MRRKRSADREITSSTASGPPSPSRGRGFVHEKSFELTKLFSVSLREQPPFAAKAARRRFLPRRGIFQGTPLSKCRGFTLFRHTARAVQGAKAKSAVFASAKNYIHTSLPPPRKDNIPIEIPRELGMTECGVPFYRISPLTEQANAGKDKPPLLQGEAFFVYKIFVPKKR